MLSKKSIVLSGQEGTNQKAVLSIECEHGMLRGRVRLYNFSSEPRGIISLGIYDKDKVIKAGLTKSSSMLFTFQTEQNAIPECFSCAVVNFVNGEPSPILFGTSDGVSPQEDVFASVINSLKDTKSARDVEQVLDSHEIDFDDEEKKEIEEAIEKEFEKVDTFSCDKCSSCKYKEYYFSRTKALGESNLVGENQEEVKQETGNFYNEIKDQIEKLFAENKSEEYLSDLIPNSKWVKVEFDEEGDYYVFGLLYEDDKLKYVCYGVPGVYQKVPPRELSGYPVWFPLDNDKREGFGYWLTYQDADSGESVKAIVE